MSCENDNSLLHKPTATLWGLTPPQRLVDGRVWHLTHSPPSFPAAAASPRRRRAGCWTAVRGTGLPPSPLLPSKPAEEQENDFPTEKTACREESSIVYLAAGPLTLDPRVKEKNIPPLWDLFILMNMAGRELRLSEISLRKRQYSPGMVVVEAGGLGGKKGLLEYYCFGAANILLLTDCF